MGSENTYEKTNGKTMTMKWPLAVKILSGLSAAMGIWGYLFFNFMFDKHRGRRTTYWEYVWNVNYYNFSDRDLAAVRALIALLSLVCCLSLFLFFIPLKTERRRLFGLIPIILFGIAEIGSCVYVFRYSDMFRFSELLDMPFKYQWYFYFKYFMALTFFVVQIIVFLMKQDREKTNYALAILTICISIVMVICDAFIYNDYHVRGIPHGGRMTCIDTGIKNVATILGALLFYAVYVIVDFKLLTGNQKRKRLLKQNTVTAMGDGMIMNELTRFCPACGARFTEENNYCDQCGGALSELARPEAAPMVMNPGTYPAVNPAADVPTTGIKVLSFFIPLAGFIMWASWINVTPNKAKAAGKFTLIGVIFYVGLVILMYAIYFWWLTSLFN